MKKITVPRFRYAANLAQPKGKTKRVTLKVPFNYKTHKIYVAGLMWYRTANF